MEKWIKVFSPLLLGRPGQHVSICNYSAPFCCRIDPLEDLASSGLITTHYILVRNNWRAKQRHSLKGAEKPFFNSLTKARLSRPVPDSTPKTLGVKSAWVEQILRRKLSRREALALSVLQHLVDFGPRLPESPRIDIRTRHSLFFLPQGSVP